MPDRAANAERQRKWRAEHPDHFAEQVARQRRRTKALRILGQRHAQELDQIMKHLATLEAACD